MKHILALAFIVGASGCSGTIYTVQNPKFNDNQTEGIIFYGYKPDIQNETLDRIRNSVTGEITHTAYQKKGTSSYCQPVEKSKKVVVADYSTQYAIKYEPGLFESNKFSVVLDDGKLKSVNAEATTGIKTAAEAIQSIASIGKDSVDKSGDIKLTQYIACSSSK